MESSTNETLKRHILGRKHVVWRIDRQNRSTCVGAARAEGKSKKNLKRYRAYLRNHNTCFLRVRPDRPRCCSATWICMCGHTQEPVIYSKFHRNPFRSFGAPGGQTLAFPITLASRFYNSLYYRTSRDATINKCLIHVSVFPYLTFQLREATIAT